MQQYPDAINVIEKLAGAISCLLLRSDGRLLVVATESS